MHLYVLRFPACLSVYFAFKQNLALFFFFFCFKKKVCVLERYHRNAMHVMRTLVLKLWVISSSNTLHMNWVKQKPFSELKNFIDRGTINLCVRGFRWSSPCRRGHSIQLERNHGKLHAKAFTQRSKLDRQRIYTRANLANVMDSMRRFLKCPQLWRNETTCEGQKLYKPHWSWRYL